MLITIPVKNPLPSYIAASTMKQDVTIVTTKEDYIHAERLSGQISRIGISSSIKQMSADDDKAKQFISSLLKEEITLHCSEVNLLAACIMQAAGNTRKLFVDKEYIAIHQRTTRLVKPSELRVETLLKLRGIDYRMETVAEEGLAAKIAARYTQDAAVNWLRWVYGHRGDAPGFEDILPLVEGRDKEWKIRGWLREYVTASLKTVATDVAHSVRFSDREVAIDVAATIGHRFLAVACETQANEESCRNTALRVFSAARRLAGDLATVALVCPRNWVSRLPDLTGFPITIVPINELATRIGLLLRVDDVDIERERERRMWEHPPREPSD